MSYYVPLFMVTEIDPVVDEIKRKNLIVFDVGANTGIWTKALMMHSDSLIDRIFLFEPLPGNFKKLTDRKSKGFFYPNENKLNLFNIGISSEIAQLEINHESESSTYASLEVLETLLGPRSVPLNEKTLIKCTTIDSFCKEKNINQIDFLKVDVEGHEYSVLKGAKSMIENHQIKNIIFEFGTHQLFINNQFKVFWDFFQKYNYKLYRLRGGENGFGKVAINQYHTNFEDYSKVRMYYASVEHELY